MKEDTKNNMKEDQVIYNVLSSNELKNKLKTCTVGQQFKTFTDFPNIHINEDPKGALKRAYL